LRACCYIRLPRHFYLHHLPTACLLLRYASCCRAALLHYCILYIIPAHYAAPPHYYKTCLLCGTAFARTTTPACCRRTPLASLPAAVLRRCGTDCRDGLPVPGNAAPTTTLRFFAPCLFTALPSLPALPAPITECFAQEDNTFLFYFIGTTLHSVLFRLVVHRFRGYGIRCPRCLTQRTLPLSSPSRALGRVGALLFFYTVFTVLWRSRSPVAAKQFCNGAAACRTIFSAAISSLCTWRHRDVVALPAVNNWPCLRSFSASAAAIRAVLLLSPAAFASPLPVLCGSAVWHAGGCCRHRLLLPLLSTAAADSCVASRR
jgi:hypothetical protein